MRKRAEGVTTAKSYCTLAVVNARESDGPPGPATEDVAERAQRRDELAALVDLLPEGLMAFDRKGRCVLFNESACKIVNRRREEWMGKTLSEVAPQALGSTFDREFQRCLVDRVTTALEQTYYPPRDRWYQSIFRPSPDGGVLLQFRDVAFEAKPGGHRGVIPLDREPSDLTLICRDAIDAVKRGSPDRRVEFTSDGDTRGVWDRRWLTLVVTSLLGNAIGGSLPGTAIQVTAREAAPDVTLAVQHFGSVIPADGLSTLFDPSPRSAMRTSRRQTDFVGPGLGLFLTRRIIEAHGGSILAESGPLHGTTLTAKLRRAVTTELRWPAVAT